MSDKQKNHYCQIQRTKKITRVYYQWSKKPLERSHEVTSGQLRFYRMLRISFSKIFIAPKNCREILGRVFRAIFELGDLVDAILNFERFVTSVTDMDAIVNQK